MVKIVGSFEVDDWVHWKKTFDAHSEAREKANIKSIYVGNELENNNSLLFLNNAFTNKCYKITVKKNYSLKKPLVVYHSTNNKINYPTQETIPYK